MYLAAAGDRRVPLPPFRRVPPCDVRMLRARTDEDQKPGKV
jgi:hypothetical protein